MDVTADERGAGAAEIERRLVAPVISTSTTETRGVPGQEADAEGVAASPTMRKPARPPAVRPSATTAAVAASAPLAVAASPRAARG